MARLLASGTPPKHSTAQTRHATCSSVRTLSTSLGQARNRILSCCRSPRLAGLTHSRICLPACCSSCPGLEPALLDHSSGPPFEPACAPACTGSSLRLPSTKDSRTRSSIASHSCAKSTRQRSLPTRPPNSASHSSTQRTPPAATPVRLTSQCLIRSACVLQAAPCPLAATGCCICTSQPDLVGAVTRQLSQERKPACAAGAALVDSALSAAVDGQERLSPGALHEVYVRTRTRVHSSELATPEATLRALLAAAAADPAATPAERRALAPFADACEPASDAVAAASCPPPVATPDAPPPVAPPSDAYPLNALQRLLTHAIDVPAVLADVSGMAPTALAEAVAAAGPQASHNAAQLQELFQAHPNATDVELAAVIATVIASAGARAASIALMHSVEDPSLPCTSSCSLSLAWCSCKPLLWHAVSSVTLRSIVRAHVR